MAKCVNCNVKVGKSDLVDGICRSCVSKREQDAEMELLTELAEEQSEIGSERFWSDMKKAP